MALDGFSMDYWQPAPALAGLVSGYHRYVVRAPAGQTHRDVFFPAWANLRIKLPGEPWTVRLAATTYPIDGAVLFGATSHAGFSESGAGAVIGAGITPLGWSRLTGLPASRFADRVTPLGEVLGGDLSALARLNGEADPTPVLDRFFLDRMRVRRSDEARIVAMHEFLARGSADTVAQAAVRLGVSARRFNDLSNHVFGFGPKLLLRRARFLESLMELASDSPLPDSARISAGYHDHSHFIRDAHEFLGMSPREFLKMRRPMNAASMTKRTAVLGAPAQALLKPRAAA